MPTFNDTIRVFGDELDETDTFIDATITGYSLDGKVHLEEDVENGPRTWTVHTDSIQQWQRDDVLARRADLNNPDHDIWSVIESLETHASDQALAAIEGELRTVTKEVFTGSIRAMRDGNRSN